MKQDLKHDNDSNLQADQDEEDRRRNMLPIKQYTPVPFKATIVATPGIDEWRLFMECFIRLKRSYLCRQDMMYRFKVFKGKLETSGELMSMKDGCCYEFDRSFDLTTEEMLKSSIHKLILRNHQGYMESEQYRKDPWRLFMNFLIRKKRIYKSSVDMMQNYRKFNGKFRTLERLNKEVRIGGSTIRLLLLTFLKQNLWLPRCMDRS